MAEEHLFFSEHALRRMFEREIRTGDVVKVLATGETIAGYPDDEPLPSRLMLGFIGEKPLHVVVNSDRDGTTYIIPAYPPDPDLWEPDFKTRRGK